MADLAEGLSPDPDDDAHEPAEAPEFADPQKRDPERGEAQITVEIHERQQLEVQLAHELPRTATGQNDQQATSLELYFFIPRNVGVTATNYPRDEFYGDLTTFLRIDLPNVTLEELAAGSHSSLAKFQRHIDAIRAGHALLPLAPLAVEVKLFGHTFTEAVRRRSRALLGELPAGRRGVEIRPRPQAERERRKAADQRQPADGRQVRARHHGEQQRPEPRQEDDGRKQGPGNHRPPPSASTRASTTNAIASTRR